MNALQAKNILKDYECGQFMHNSETKKYNCKIKQINSKFKQK